MGPHCSFDANDKSHERVVENGLIAHIRDLALHVLVCVGNAFYDQFATHCVVNLGHLNLIFTTIPLQGTRNRCERLNIRGSDILIIIKKALIYKRRGINWINGAIRQIIGNNMLTCI